MLINKHKLLIIIVSVLLITTACNSSQLINESKQDDNQEYQRYSKHFLDIFDTVIQVIGYTQSEQEFQEYTNYIEKRLWEFHDLADKYHNYSGINNVKTINDNAGKVPVPVDKQLFDLIVFAKEWHAITHGKMNIAIGHLVEVWDTKMEEALQDPENVTLPGMNELQIAAQYINIEDVIIDEQEMTVYLANEKMKLDLGAITKGYAAEIVAQEVLELGFEHAVIISGGNWKIIGEPLEEHRDHWRIAIQNPEVPYSVSAEGILETVELKRGAFDTSGDYQRFAYVEGERIHHIIDTDTLMPGNYNRAVTVIADHSGVADYLSTELFLLPYEKGLKLVNSLAGIEALWVLQDGEIKKTEGMKMAITK